MCNPWIALCFMKGCTCLHPSANHITCLSPHRASHLEALCSLTEIADDPLQVFCLIYMARNVNDCMDFEVHNSISDTVRNVCENLMLRCRITVGMKDISRNALLQLVSNNKHTQAARKLGRDNFGLVSWTAPFSRKASNQPGLFWLLQFTDCAYASIHHNPLQITETYTQVKQ